MDFAKRICVLADIERECERERMRAGEGEGDMVGRGEIVRGIESE